MSADKDYLQRLERLSGFRRWDDCVLEPPAACGFRAPALKSAITLLRTSRQFHPFSFQERLIRAISNARELSAVLVMPTGAGKTSVAAAAMLNWLSIEDCGTVLWIAPQRELLLQAFRTSESIWASGIGPTSLDLSILPDDEQPVFASRPRVIFATPQLVLARGVDRLLAGHPRCVGVVIDEVHHFGAQAFGEVASSLGNLSGRLLGLSATPSPHDGVSRKKLQETFDDGLIQSVELGGDPVRILQSRGVLAAVRHHDIPVGNNVRAGVYVGASRWRKRDLIVEPERWNATLSAIESSRPGDCALVSCFDRAHGQALLHALRKRDRVSAAYIDGRATISDRFAAIERLLLGQVAVLLQVQLFAEGVDLPGLNRLVLTYPVTSAVEASQLVGRVLRGPKLGGREAGLVCSSDIDDDWLAETLHRGDYWADGWSITEY
jgi:DNA repair protein RadD